MIPRLKHGLDGWGLSVRIENPSLSSYRTIIDHSYVECSLHHFICFNSVDSHSKPLRQALLLIPFPRWGK